MYPIIIFWCLRKSLDGKKSFKDIISNNIIADIYYMLKDDRREDLLAIKGS